MEPVLENHFVDSFNLSNACVALVEENENINVSSLAKIPISSVSPIHGIPFDIFVCDEGGRCKFLCLSDSMLSDDEISELKQGRVDIFIRKEELPSFSSYMKESLKTISDEDVDINEKSQIVYSAAALSMSELFNNAESKAMIEDSKTLASIMLEDLMKDDAVFLSMLEVLSHDYYTYSHCVNVSIYSITIGKKLGLTDNEMEDLASGSILHDIGKARIDLKILNKQGRLTEDEFEIMKTHPSEGVLILEGLGEKNQNILDSVNFHHEKIDGSGYPKKLKDEKIPLIAQIVAIADIFDALTTKRSYKDALTSYTALRLMKSRDFTGLNETILNALVRSFYH